MEKENCELERQGWIEPSDASPIVVVKKKNSDEIRLCVNYKKLNDITVGDPMPMPEIDDILTKIGQSTMFSTVDMCKGYYAIGLNEGSRDYTTFCTPNAKLPISRHAIWSQNRRCIIYTVAQKGPERCKESREFY